MSAFEFMFSFHGLLLGLTLAEIVSGFSRALDAREERPLGLITPLLTVVLIFAIIALWGAAWRDLRQVVFSFDLLAGSAVTTLAFYFSATQLFPRERSTARSLDEHFFSHRRAILGGVIFSWLVLTASSLVREWDVGGGDAVFWSRIVANAFWLGTLLVALLTRFRAAVVAALAANLAFCVYWFLLR
jgi:hypothetical protein